LPSECFPSETAQNCSQHGRARVGACPGSEGCAVLPQRKRKRRQRPGKPNPNCRRKLSRSQLRPLSIAIHYPTLLSKRKIRADLATVRNASTWQLDPPRNTQLCGQMCGLSCCRWRVWNPPSRPAHRRFRDPASGSQTVTPQTVLKLHSLLRQYCSALPACVFSLPHRSLNLRAAALA